MVHILAVALSLDAGAASHFAKLALQCAEKEYPNKLDHVMNGPHEVQSPRALHPAFYGCYDWHSTVHGHWMLVRLLRQFPQLPEAPEIRRQLDEHLSEQPVAVEVAYFGQPNRKSFERTYGWAWLLKLQAELRSWDSPEARRWAEALQPLADTVTRALSDFLPRQTYPIRTGVHPNTAFRPALAQLGDTHAQASLPFIASGSYEGEHWLGTFAVQMLDAREQGTALTR